MTPRVAAVFRTDVRKVSALPMGPGVRGPDLSIIGGWPSGFGGERRPVDSIAHSLGSGIIGKKILKNARHDRGTFGSQAEKCWSDAWVTPIGALGWCWSG
jgi:hypothetical protein